MGPIGRHDDGPLFSDEPTKDRLLEGNHAQACQIFGGGVVIRMVEPARIAEMRIAQSERARFGVHQADELCFISTHMFDSGKTGVIGGHDQHPF